MRSGAPVVDDLTVAHACPDCGRPGHCVRMSCGSAKCPFTWTTFIAPWLKPICSSRSAPQAPSTRRPASSPKRARLACARARSTWSRPTTRNGSTSSAWGRRARPFPSLGRGASARARPRRLTRRGPRLSARRVGDSGRLDADLPQLSERRGNGAAEEKAGLRCRSAADERRSRCVQHASRVGQQRAKVRAEAGREDDRVKALGGRLLEVDALAGEACDVAAKLDPSVANRIERADIDERHAPVLLDGLERPLGRSASSRAFRWSRSRTGAGAR